MDSIPQKAATVILLREGTANSGFEVFLLKRHEMSSFMGGNYVFPGGRVDREDGSRETCELAKGVTPEEACRTLGEALSPEESLAHYITGVRELFEEAGVLFAYEGNLELFRFRTEEERERLHKDRLELQKGQKTLCQMAREWNLWLALDQLQYYAHWITPEARRLRFDTRFFIARLPEGQEVSFDRKETVAEVWLSPRMAIEENSAGRIPLSPPTLQVLEDLSRYERIEGVFSALKGKEIRPILPILKNLDGEVLIFPWDPEYEIFRRGDLPSTIHHGRLSKPGDKTTRLIFREGIWLPYCRQS